MSALTCDTYASVRGRREWALDMQASDPLDSCFMGLAHNLLATSK